MFEACLFFIRKSWTESFPRKSALFSEILTVALNILVVWYTSVAFGHQLFGESTSGQRDYFSFILIGETALMIPLSLFLGVGKNLKSSIADGTIDYYLLLPYSLQRLLMMATFGNLAREILRIVLIWIAAATLIPWSLSLNSLILVLGLQLISLPLFLGLGFLASLPLLIFQRGEASISRLGTVLFVFAGSYFPLRVLPQAVQNLSIGLSPFTWLLQLTRWTVDADANWDWTKILFYLMASLIIFGLGFGSFTWGLHRFKKSGSTLPLSL